MTDFRRDNAAAAAQFERQGQIDSMNAALQRPLPAHPTNAAAPTPIQLEQRPEYSVPRDRSTKE